MTRGRPPSLGTYPSADSAPREDAGVVTRSVGLPRRLADAVVGRLAAIGRCIAAHDDLCVSLLPTLVFYYPSLRHVAQNAGYLYTGDVLGYYLPPLIKTHAIIGAGSFDALDFSLFDGSSDFFLSPNFFAMHPLVALFCLLWPASDLSLTTHRQADKPVGYTRRVMSIEDAATAFGYAPRTRLEQGVRQTVEWLRADGDRVARWVAEDTSVRKAHAAVTV